MNRNITRAGLLALATASVVGLAACSSSGTSSAAHDHMSSTSTSTNSSAQGAPASGPHNQADVDFATNMIPHHGQAVQMADMALRTSKNADVRKLAKTIKGAQDPEIQTMSGWLRGWKRPVPAKSMGSMGGMHMEGMMSAADMAKLAKATGAAFDKMWLTMMITHHKGAISMSTTELSAGSNPAAKTLGKSIIAGQSSEVATMTKLLTRF